MPSETEVKTADGLKLSPGDRAFNYYDMKPGVIRDVDSFSPTDDPWFTFEHEDGTRATLNGERICSRAYAERKFPEAFADS